MGEGCTLDWPNIREEMDNEEWEDEQEGQTRSIYLGTITGLSPSGRLYAPWSAVEDETLNADAKWYEANIDAAEAVGLAFESGEGDGNDLYAIEYRDFPEQGEGAEMEDELNIKEELDRIYEHLREGADALALFASLQAYDAEQEDLLKVADYISKAMDILEAI